jgi:hypothetical protein
MNGNSEAKAMTAANWIALLVAFAVYTGGAWALITSHIDSRVEPLKDKVIALEKLQEKYDVVLQQAASDHSERLANEREIETQFRASDEARNVQFATQQRMDALLWEKVFSNRYPSDAIYYPHIAK